MNVDIYIVYYTGPYTSTLLPDANALLARINPLRRQRFEQRIDGAQRALDLATLRLLELGMHGCGQSSFQLADVDYPAKAGVTEKPVWRSAAAADQSSQQDRQSPRPRRLDFSISHTRSLVGCAIASGGRVGLDVESPRRVDPSTVQRLLREDSDAFREVTPQNALQRWTQIEAVLKGAGVGIMHGREIEWRERSALLRGEEWWLHEIDFGSNYIAHVATNVQAPRIHVRRYDTL